LWRDQLAVSKYWAVAKTLAHRERFAAERLEAAGFQTFLPRAKLNGRAEPLFGGYVFVRIVDRWRAVERTVGVLALVRFGDRPARCADAEIADLQSRIDSQGLVRLPERPPTPKKPRRKIPIGTRVKIAAGPFRGFSAIYAGQTAREREKVLIELLGRQAPLELQPGQIA
jgi:transcriptional antiterminator RfaH